MKKPWNLDVPVLLIFFVRDETFSQVFAEVRKARPRVLLLWQDGPRAGHPADAEGIQRCRAIAEDIDWECEVHRMYHENNMGCDPSTFNADEWAFGIVDRCIVLEDDQKPSQDFFIFCKELLDRYKNDERISHICGYNFLGMAQWCPNDYLFSYTGSGAWASWRRVAQKWDRQYDFLDNEYDIQNVKFHYGKRSQYWTEYAQRHKKTGKAHWESIIGMSAHLESRYAIIPKYNLVKNLGISDNATHSSVSDMRLIPQKDRSFYGDVQKMEFPLKHPKYITPDAEYIRRLERISRPNLLRRAYYRAELLLRMIRYGRFDLLKKAVIKRVRRKNT